MEIAQRGSNNNTFSQKNGQTKNRITNRVGLWMSASDYFGSDFGYGAARFFQLDVGLGLCQTFNKKFRLYEGIGLFCGLGSVFYVKHVPVADDLYEEVYSELALFVGLDVDIMLAYNIASDWDAVLGLKFGAGTNLYMLQGYIGAGYRY